MEFVFFSFREQINGLDDERANGAMPPKFLGLEPPLAVCTAVYTLVLFGHVVISPSQHVSKPVPFNHVMRCGTI